MIDSYDWQRLRSAGISSDVPQALIDLTTSQTREEAESAYWKLDNAVVRQGSLFPSAVPTTVVLLEAIQRCVPEVRVKILELLVQIVSGETDPDEVGFGVDIKQLCLDELVHGFSIVVHWLEVGTTEEQHWCVDLTMMCGLHSLPLRQRSRIALRRLRDETVEAPLRELCNASLNELEG
ncbi:MAG: hypothetical protein ACR2JX_06130 [Mycobacteriales bacterium]